MKTNHELLGRQSAIAVARGLYRMLGHHGNTVDSLRELIAVPAWIERALRAYAEESPADVWWIERSIKFRAAVAGEFERLVREGAPPEAVEADPVAGEEVLAAMTA